MVDPEHNVTCKILCNIYGIAKFIEWIQEADPYIDPIYWCQAADRCFVKDCNKATGKECAKITKMQVSHHINYFDPVVFYATFNVSGNYGTGMFCLVNDATIDGNYMRQGGICGLTTQFHEGEQTVTFMLNQNALYPGSWRSSIWICSGACNSTMPHARVFDYAYIHWQNPDQWP